MEEGLQYFREVIERCPGAALRLIEIYREGLTAGSLPPPERDPRSAFWSSLDVDVLQKELASRGGSAA